MKHTLYSLEHDLKSSFLERVHGHLDESLIERYLEAYCMAGEHQDGVGFWDHFENVKEVIEDFKRFVDFTSENDWD